MGRESVEAPRTGSTPGGPIRRFLLWGGADHLQSAFSEAMSRVIGPRTRRVQHIALHKGDLSPFFVSATAQ